MRRFCLVLVLGWPIGGQAFFETAEGLLEICGGDVVAYSRCVGFLQGVSDTLKSLKSRGRIDDVCPPQGTTSRQLEQIFRRYTAENPRLLNIAASTVAIDAYRAAWKCRRR